MNPRKLFTRMSTGVAILGVALCVPAAMLAQDTAPAPPPQGTTDQQPNPGAQPMHHHQPPTPEHQLQRLTKMLNLTQDQQQQMLPILQDQHKQMDTIQNNTALSPQQRHQQMRAAMMDTHQKLEALMTDTQKQQFEQAMQQRREHMRNSGVAPVGAGRASASSRRTKWSSSATAINTPMRDVHDRAEKSPFSALCYFCHRDIDPRTLWKNESAPAVGTF